MRVSGLFAGLILLVATTVASADILRYTVYPNDPTANGMMGGEGYFSVYASLIGSDTNGLASLQVNLNTAMISSSVDDYVMNMLPSASWKKSLPLPARTDAIGFQLLRSSDSDGTVATRGIITGSQDTLKTASTFPILPGFGKTGASLNPIWSQYIGNYGTSRTVIDGVQMDYGYVGTGDPAADSLIPVGSLLVAIGKMSTLGAVTSDPAQWFNVNATTNKNSGSPLMTAGYPTGATATVGSAITPEFAVVAVPEPATWALLASLSAMGLAWFRRR